MKKEYSSDLNELLSLFDESLSTEDIIAAKILADVSEKIVKQRVEMGMTQKQFARFMGVSQGMISKWESADYNFSVKALAEIASKLNLDLNICFERNKVLQMPEKTKRLNSMVPSGNGNMIPQEG